MRWMGAGVIAVALAASACTTTEPAVSPTTSIRLDAPPVVEATDSMLRYGIPSSPADPWAHYRTSCDTSCGVVFGAITDTLFATATSGETVGLLVERFESNNDHTVHTWRLRDGIVFSDGTPFDAAAAKINIDSCRHSALTGPGLAGIDDVRAEGHTLTITTLAPWAALPAHFAETPCGHMFSAAWLVSLADLPMRTEGAPFFDTTIAARPASGDPTAPVGLGPFVMRSFVPGNGNSTRLERNPTYWRGPEGITGELLPGALDIELVVIDDAEIRGAALEAGQFDFVLSRADSGPAAARISVLSTDAFSDVVHLAMNTGESENEAAAGDGSTALRLLSCRRALAASLDRAALSAEFGGTPSDGPFRVLSRNDEATDADADESPASAVFDREEAARLGDRCVDDHGGDVDLTLFASVGDLRAEALVEMVDDALGALPGGGSIRIDLQQLDSGALGVAALLGDFDLLLWEGFGGTHPDLHFRWWFSEASAPVGDVATNVSRIEDPTLDRALVALRRADDLSAGQRAANDVQRSFEANVWTIWLTDVVWELRSRPTVEVDASRATPEGVELVPFVNGVHRLDRVRRVAAAD